MGLHMREPQWSGVRRMTHFDRYEVVMNLNYFVVMSAVTNDFGLE